MSKTYRVDVEVYDLHFKQVDPVEYRITDDNLITAKSRALRKVEDICRQYNFAEGDILVKLMITVDREYYDSDDIFGKWNGKEFTVN